MNYNFSSPEKLPSDPQNSLGVKICKNVQTFTNFGVLELYKVTEGSGKLVWHTKKFYLNELKLFCDQKSS